MQLKEMKGCPKFEKHDVMAAHVNGRRRTKVRKVKIMDAPLLLYFLS